MAYDVEDGGLLNALMELCKIMIDKDYPCIHDKYGDIFPTIYAQINIDEEELEKLSEAWGEWSEFEG